MPILPPYYVPRPGMLVESIDPPKSKAVIVDVRKARRSNYYNCMVCTEMGEQFDSISTCWVPVDSADLAPWYRDYLATSQLPKVGPLWRQREMFPRRLIS